MIGTNGWNPDTAGTSYLEERAAGSSAPACSATDLLLAAVLLGRFSPLAPHHAGAIRERLRELNDNELREMVSTGKWPNTTAHQRREAAYGDAAGSGSESTTKGATT